MKIPWKFRMLLWWVERTFQTPIYELPAAEARAFAHSASDRSEAFLDYRRIRLHHVEDQQIDTRNGKTTIRIYHPSAAKNLPVIMYFHGGGFVIHSIDTHDRLCRRIARDHRAIVISVNYRLAPEYKYPAGLHDCYDATCWAHQHAAALGGRPDRLLVMGDSAGGNLAAAVCLMARDEGGPPIFHQILLYPCTDGTLSQPSVEINGEGYLLTRPIMEWFMDHYMNSESDIMQPYYSVLHAENLAQLPPATILTAQYDPLLDDGRLFAERLKDAGNQVGYKNYKGMIHGFFGMPRMSKVVLQAHREVSDKMKLIM